MHRLLGDMKAQPTAWPFLNPVDGEEVVDYYEVVKRPMGQSLLLTLFQNATDHPYQT